MPMRILHLIGSLSPADGGPPQAVRQLALAWQKIGVEVEVVSVDDPSEPFIPGHPFPVHALGGRRLGRFCYSPHLRPWLRHHLPRFDGALVHMIWSWPGLSMHAEAHRAGKSYCVFTHGGLDPWFNRRYPLKHLKKLVFWPWQYPVLRDALRVLFTTDSERDLAKTSFRPHAWNPQVVPYGLNDPVGDPAAQIGSFFNQFPALGGRRFLLFLGRLHEKKGCDLLVRAFAKVAGADPELQLVMAGPDQAGLQATLQRMAQDLDIAERVHWPGMLSGDLKWGALRAADAFVLPSHQENFGIAVAESLAAGRPVLISKEVNISPEIEADQAGLVEPDTQDGTDNLLRRWLAMTPAERDAMAARCCPTFRRRYSMGDTVLAIRRLFQEAQAGSRRP
jgi:glycosyltransferase involved in cell wall biosynthesis